MLFSLVSLLASSLLVLPCEAISVARLAAEDASPVNLTQELHRRVRVGGGSGGGGGGGIKDLFLIDDKSGCDGRIAILDQWLQEAATIHTGVEHAYMHAVGKWPPYVVHWMTFFGVQFDTATMTLTEDRRIKRLNNQIWTDIGDHIDRVTQFLSGGGLKGPQKNGEHPRLFCSGDAFEIQDGSRAVRDENGKDVVTDKDETTGEPTDYLTIDKAFSSQRAQGNNVFWVEGFKGYDISKTTLVCPALVNGKGRYGRTARPVSSGLFDYVNQHGETVKYKLGMANRHMVLCPPAFDVSTGAHSVPSLAEVTAGRYPDPQARGAEDRNTGLDKFLTKGSTLYHELYHLTDNDNTLPETYHLPEILGDAASPNTREQNSHNPESFTYLAMALHLYRSQPPQGKERVIYAGPYPVKATDWGHKEGDWAMVSALP